MKIQVTEVDIVQGQRGRSYHCPISLAIRRATGKYCSIFNTIELYEDINYRILFEEIKTSTEVFKKLQDYDSGKEMIPFEFEANFIRI